LDKKKQLACRFAMAHVQMDPSYATNTWKLLKVRLVLLLSLFFFFSFSFFPFLLSSFFSGSDSRDPSRERVGTVV
jgi:hypothetical protein